MATRTSVARRAPAAVVAVVCATLAALVNPPEPAWACSCAVVDPEAALAAADAAFVGTLEARRESNRGPVRSTADPVTLGFRVEGVLKGDLGDRVDVVTAASGASCGIEARPGQRLTLLLTRSRGNRWESGLCDQLAAERLNVHSFTEDEGRSRWWLLLAAGGAIAATGVAALAFRRRRRTG